MLSREAERAPLNNNIRTTITYYYNDSSESNSGSSSIVPNLSHLPTDNYDNDSQINNNDNTNLIYNNIGDEETEDETTMPDEHNRNKRNRYQYNNYEDYNNNYQYIQNNYKKRKTTTIDSSFKFTQRQFNFSLGSTANQITQSLTFFKNSKIGNIIPRNYYQKRKSIYVINNRYGYGRLHVECSLLCKRARNERKRGFLYQKIIDKLELEFEEQEELIKRKVHPYHAYQAGFRTWKGKKIFQFNRYTLEGEYDASNLSFFGVRGLAGLRIVVKHDKIMFYSQEVLGLFIPIKNINNEIVAAQIKPLGDNPRYRYITLSSSKSHHVTIHNRYEEIPLAFWEYGYTVSDALFVIEGVLKSYITSLRTQSHCLGAIGSDFLASETTLHRYLQEFKEKYPEIKKAYICPDAGMIFNENITANYIELSIVLEYYFSEVYFLWWGQLDKYNDDDIDELPDDQLFNWMYLTREEYVCKHNREMIQRSRFLRFYRDELKRKRMYSTILQRCWQPSNTL
ncbi:hypothetical protein ABK040_003897 [Willaertia magna]